jgi:hypothetical protein
LLCRDYVVDALSDEEICQCFQSRKVLCVSDLRNLSSHSGQTALVTLVSLLSRMGMQVGLSIPEVALLSPQLPLLGQSVRESLIASSETLVTGATLRYDSAAAMLSPGGSAAPIGTELYLWKKRPGAIHGLLNGRSVRWLALPWLRMRRSSS